MWLQGLFTCKGFASVNEAIVKMDYEAVLTESLRLIKYPDKTKAAKACYNCAVLYERKNQPGEARAYLLQSLSLSSLGEARYMLNDIDR